MKKNKLTQNALMGMSLGCVLLFSPFAAHAYETFNIRAIRVEGNQRLEEGSVLSYLALNVGDELSEAAGQQAVRALYQSGLFSDVQLARDSDNTLVVNVTERPLITAFNMKGNKKIGGDELKSALAKQGLVEGQMFKRQLLAQVEQELKRQYFANGYYDAEINTTITDLPDNRVNIDINVVEGEVARIKSINIIGNEAFSDNDLLEKFELHATSAWRFFQSSDRYSKQQLFGDLEGLTSYYQDRGYLRFNIDSVQVALSEDRKDIYVTVNVNEGAQYKIKGYRLLGDSPVPEAELRKLVTIEKGEVFSRKRATESSNKMSARLSDEGFAFAKVSPLPDIDDTTREVEVSFLVETGRKIYVRRLNFIGNSRTNDETLRREVRQMEAAVFSRAAIERSRTRLSRLPFLQNVDVQTQKVPGTEDLVDVTFTVVERAPGSVQFGVGFSGAQGFLVNGSLTHSNFRGTGQSLSVQATSNTVGKDFSMSLTEPYATDTGISRTISAYYRDSDQVVRTASGYSTNALGGSLTYGLPISEVTNVRLGVGVEKLSLRTFVGSPTEVDAFTRKHGADFVNYELRTGLTTDNRNRGLFATEGYLDRLTFDITLPGSDLNYYNLNLRHEQYFPLYKDKLIVQIIGQLGYAAGYGGDDVPPYERYFAGGFETVRGYNEATLGALDSNGNNYGGELRTTFQTELILPTPLESNNKSTRLSLFYDMGNTFNTVKDFDVSGLRHSAGIAFYWLTPILGVLKVSYAIPLNIKPGDDRDAFQVSFGTGF